MSTFVGSRSDYTGDINSVMVQEANRLDADIHAENVHTSAWLDLIEKDAFPQGQGYQLQSLIYERALPTNAAQDAIGANWGDFASSALRTGQTHSGQVSGVGGLLNDSAVDFVGPLNNQTQGGGADNPPSRIEWRKRLEPYSLKRATIWSPEISVDDMQFAAMGAEQLAKSFDALAEGIRYTWEERNRDEYQRVCYYVVEVTATTSITTTSITGGDADDRFDNGAAGTVVNLSNAVMDRIYNALVRAGAGRNPWGREENRPIFGLMISSNASYGLKTETDIRTDVRESSTVDDLLKPLGISKAFRGFYHIIDDLAPRYRAASSDAGYTDADYLRVEPYTISSNVIVPNSAYEATTAKYEVAFVLHREVMKCCIPNPHTGHGAASFDPVDYSGKFHWVNIKSVDLNPLGTVGNFLAVLASASKVIKPRFGYAIIYDRTSGTYGA